MAHLVEKMFYVQLPGQRDFPWHIQETADRTTVLAPDKRPKTFKKARKLAGLDWDPIGVPMFSVPGSHFAADGSIVKGDGEPVAAEEMMIVKRSDTGAFLTSAQRTYELITNTDMGMIIDVILNGHPVRYETGGCLDGGKAVWLMLQMGDLLEIPGDPSPYVQYLAILNRHDGRGACKAIATNTRIQCANTFHAADFDAKAKMQTFSFYHKARWREHVEELQADVIQALRGANTEMERVAEVYTELMKVKVKKKPAREWMDEFVFPGTEFIKLKPLAAKNVLASRDVAWDIYNGPTCEGLTGTAHGLMMAGIEWAQHERAYHNTGTYLNRSVYTRDEFKFLAYRMAAEFAGYDPKKMALAS